MTLEVRPATQSDVREYYEGDPPISMRAWVAVLDGKVVGIAGVAYGGLARVQDRPEAFSQFKPELEPYLTSAPIRRAIRRVVKMIRETRPGPVAIASRKHPGAPALLARLGAQRIGSHELGEVFQWN